MIIEFPVHFEYQINSKNEPVTSKEGIDVNELSLYIERPISRDYRELGPLIYEITGYVRQWRGHKIERIFEVIRSLGSNKILELSLDYTESIDTPSEMTFTVRFYDQDLNKYFKKLK